MDGPPAASSSSYSDKETYGVAEGEEILSQEDTSPPDVQGTFFDASGQAVAASADVRYCGFSSWETTGSATAQISIYAGTDNSGELLDRVNLAANESTRELYTKSIPAAAGLYVELNSGSAEGIIRWVK